MSNAKKLNLAQKLRVEFISTYLVGLKTLSAFTETGTNKSIQNSNQRICSSIVSRLQLSANTIQRLRNHPANRVRTLELLQDAWYHECALSNPTNILSDSEEEAALRMSFPPWKIIQFYYATYCFASAAVRLLDSTTYGKQMPIINRFAELFIASPDHKQKSFFEPMSFHFESGQLSPTPNPWTNTHKILYMCLKSCSPRPKVSVLHYLRELRDWVNYADAHAFIVMYSRNQRIALENYLLKTMSNVASSCELITIHAVGYRKTKHVFSNFKRPLYKHYGITPVRLDERFSLYDLQSYP